MDKAFSIITRTIARVYPTGFYLYYTIAAIAFILARRKRRREDTLLGLYSVVMFCLILMPFFTLLIWRFLRNGGVYWRVLWLIPYSILIAFAAVELIFKPKKSALKVLTAGVITAAVLLGGTNVYRGGAFQKTTCREKLPQITMTTMSVINENAEKTGNPYKSLCAPVDIFCQIRQVDATILQYGSRQFRLEDLDESWFHEYYYMVMYGLTKDHKGLITRFMLHNNMNYIVFPKKYSLMKTLLYSKCQKLYDQDGWQIWYYPTVPPGDYAYDFNS